MARQLLLTGYPGFLGSELLPRLLEQRPDANAICVVQPKSAALARERAARHGTRVKLIEGDITQPLLGLDSATLAAVAEIYHLAAVYDLAVGREPAMRVNVGGTREVIRAAQACTTLERLHYVSTCYVSGAHAGVYRESDLDVGQRFNNVYEETKFLGELEVQRAAREGMPVTIYRPAIVVGDSRTGATQKYDGPYYVIRWILRQPGIAVMPMAGDPRRVRLNVVPRDFVIDAISLLSRLSQGAREVYHLADPAPLTTGEIVRAIAAATGKRIIQFPLPASVAKFALRRVPGVQALMQIPPVLVDYMVHPTLYDTTNASADLAGSGIAVSRFEEYLPRLVEFVRAHREIGSAAMA